MFSARFDVSNVLLIEYPRKLTNCSLTHLVSRLTPMRSTPLFLFNSLKRRKQCRSRVLLQTLKLNLSYILVFIVDVLKTQLDIVRQWPVPTTLANKSFLEIFRKNKTTSYSLETRSEEDPIEVDKLPTKICQVSVGGLLAGQVKFLTFRLTLEFFCLNLLI